MTLTVTADHLWSRPLIQRYLAEPFVPREWLAGLVDLLIYDQDCRHILLTADPGMGKSAFVAWLTTRHTTAPRYFIRLDSLAPFASGDAVDLLLAIGHQLAQQRPDLFSQQMVSIKVRQDIGHIDSGGSVEGVHAQRLLANPFGRLDIDVGIKAQRVDGKMRGVDVEEMVLSERLRDPQQLQHLALLDPAKRLLELEPEAMIVILIDALDELRHRTPVSGMNVLDWLADCPALPPNVCIVSTARPDEGFLKLYLGRQQPYLKRHRIDPGSAEVHHDLVEYASRIVQEPEVVIAATHTGIDVVAGADAAVARATGNFLFLVMWHRALRAAAQEARWDDLRKIVTLETVPQSLAELYRMFVRLLHHTVRQQTVRLTEGGTRQRIWEAVHWPVLTALAVSRAPVTAKQLAVLSGLRSHEPLVEQAIVHMRQFLTQPPALIALFHATVAECLMTSPLTTGVPDYYIDSTMEHLRAAERIIEAYGRDWEHCTDRYALGNVVDHLVEALRDAEPHPDVDRAVELLLSLLTNISFVHRVAAELDVDTVFSGFTSAYSALDGLWPGVAEEVVRALADHGIRDTMSSGPLSADVMQATLAFRRDCADFYQSVLERATDTANIEALIDDGSIADDVHAEFLDARVNVMRRIGQTRAAQALAEQVIADGQARARTLYERGYIRYLASDVEGALNDMAESAQAADRAGDQVGRWISELVHDQFAFQADRLDPVAYRHKLETAAAFFTQVDATASPHAKRWLMNSHAHRFDLACLTDDLPGAERAWAFLSENDWISQMRPEYAARWLSRLLLLRGDYAAATTSYASLLPQLEAITPTLEGIDRDRLDYGRALQGIGEVERARQQWHIVAGAPDTDGSWPWRRRALTLLGADTL